MNICMYMFDLLMQCTDVLETIKLEKENPHTHLFSDNMIEYHFSDCYCYKP